MTTPLSDPQSIHNPSTGGIATAAWGDNLRDNIVTLGNMAGCAVRRTTVQTVSNATVSALAFNAADLRDTDAYHDIVTNNSRMTVPSGLGGWYWAGATIGWAANGTGYRDLLLRVNGATTIARTRTNATTAEFAFLSIHAPVQLSATDYVEVIVFQTSGGNLDVLASGPEPRGWLIQHAL